MASSVGSTAPRTGLRPIIIDGSNVAFCHGLHQEFSVKGIELVMAYFQQRGHLQVRRIQLNWALDVLQTILNYISVINIVLLYCL